jgi:hypothetical protein
MKTLGDRKYNCRHIKHWHKVEVSGLLQTLVTLGRGTQTQVLNRQEVGWATEGVLKLQRKENSLSLAKNQTPISQSTAIPFPPTLTKPVISHYIKAKKNFQKQFL